MANEKTIDYVRCPECSMVYEATESNCPQCGKVTIINESEVNSVVFNLND